MRTIITRIVFLFVFFFFCKSAVALNRITRTLEWLRIRILRSNIMRNVKKGKEKRSSGS